MAPGQDRPVFSKQGIEEKNRIARENYEQKIEEMRKAFEDVVGTPSGQKVFQYLFLLCGGDLGSIRRTKEGVIDLNETLSTLGTKAVWETIRFNLTSETLKRIERHNWEI